MVDPCAGRPAKKRRHNFASHPKAETFDASTSSQTDPFEFEDGSVQYQLQEISSNSDSFEISASNGQSKIQLGAGLLIASIMIDDSVSFRRARDVWLKGLSASFGLIRGHQLVRGETAMKGVLLELVQVIKHKMVAKIKSECNGVVCISMDESNKKGDDKMMITLSYATSLGRVEYLCVGAVSATSKKAEESYTHTILKALDNFDPTGELSDMIHTRGTGMVDHAPTAMKLVRLVRCTISL